MIHKRCEQKLVLDCSSMYVLRSPSIKVDAAGVYPGVIQIDSAKSTSGAKLICPSCNETMSTKEQFESEILEICSFCKHYHKPSELLVTDSFSFVCVDCVRSASKKEITKEDNKIFMYFANALSNKDYPTLLTVLMKK